jgi:Domain of unknown function (DUF5615)
LIRLAADENFNSRIVRGLQRRLPDVDVLRVQDSEIAGADDPVVLEWCAVENRILLTHDFETIPGFVSERFAAGLRVAGVILASASLPIGDVIEDLMVVLTCSQDDEFENRLVFLPL